MEYPTVQYCWQQLPQSGLQRRWRQPSHWQDCCPGAMASQSIHLLVILCLHEFEGLGAVNLRR